MREKTLQGKRACKNGGRHREKRGRRKQAGPATRGVCLLQCCWRWRTVSVGCTPRKGNGVGGAKREKREGMEIPHLTLSEGQEDEGARDGHSTLHCETEGGGMWRRMNADVGRSGSGSLLRCSHDKNQWFLHTSEEGRLCRPDDKERRRRQRAAAAAAWFTLERIPPFALIPLQPGPSSFLPPPPPTSRWRRRHLEDCRHGGPPSPSPPRFLWFLPPLVYEWRWRETLPIPLSRGEKRGSFGSLSRTPFFFLLTNPFSSMECAPGRQRGKKTSGHSCKITLLKRGAWMRSFSC